MDRFTPIDRENWDREEMYRLYTEQWGNTWFSCTVRLDVTQTVRYQKEKGQKFVPAVYYAVSRGMCQQVNFCLRLHNGELGYWDKVHPMYPVLRQTGNFTFHSVPYQEDYQAFYDAYIEESVRNKDQCGAFAEPMPENVFTISNLYFMPFDSFSFAMKNTRYYYSHIISLGRYEEDGAGRLMLPFSATVNHAVVDAYHVHLLSQDIQKLLLHPETWPGRV